MKRAATQTRYILTLAVIGVLATANASAQPDRAEAGHPPSFIQRHDTDGDGRVSFAEFTASFDQIDQNGDGFIDAEEAPERPPRRHGRARPGHGRPATGEEGASQ